MLAIYTRLSREDEESKSIEHQIKEGVSFAYSNNLCYKLFNEGEGVSGTLQIEDRPILLDLVSQVQDGEITHVWMRNQNRLARDETTYHGFIAQMIKHNIKVYFDNKLVDFNDPTQSLMGSILSSINTYQAKLQSHQTKKVLRKNAAEGKVHGILPYGYSKDDESILIIDDDESKIVKRIYDLSLSGVGSRTIAQLLTKEGVPTRYNKIAKGTISTVNKYTGRVTTRDKTAIKWSGKTVIDIIKNTIYKGTRIYGGNEYDSPIIIEPNYWQKVNDNLLKNRKNTGKKVDHKYLLKGLLRCGKCGSNFYGVAKTNDPKGYIRRVSKSGRKRIDYNVYMCSSKRYSHTNCGSKSLRLIDLDTLIWGVFFKEKYLIDKIKEFISNFDVDKKEIETKEKVDTLVNDINKLNSEKTNTIRYGAKGFLTDNELEKELISINSRINSLDEELSFLTTYYSSLKNSSKLFKDKINDLDKLKHNLSFKDKRAIIHQHIEDIVLYTHFNDPTNSFVQINIYYRDNLLTPDKFIFNLKQGVAVNLFNQKVISIHHAINEEYLLELIAPVISEIERIEKNVQK